MSSPFIFRSLIGLDAGLRFSYRNIISAGITGADLFTPYMTAAYSSGVGDFIAGTAASGAETGIAPIRLNVGILYSPEMRVLGRYITGIKLSP